MTADIAFGAVGVQRDVRAVELHQQLGLVGVRPCEQAIDGGEAGAAAEDAIEAGAHFAAVPAEVDGLVETAFRLR